MNSRAKKITVFLISLAVGLSVFTGPIFNWKSDPFGTAVVSQNILKYHTLNLNRVKNYWKIPAKNGFNYQISAGKNGAYYNYPLGTPVISIPFVFIANRLGLDMLKSERLMQLLICAAVSAAIFLTVFILASRYFPFFGAVIIGLLGFYGTTVGTVAGTGLWNLDYDIMFSGLALLTIFLSVGRTTPGAGLKKIFPYLAGILLFLSFISRPTSSFLVFFILVFLLFYDRKYFLKTAAASGILFITYETLLYSSTGNILNNGYSSGSEFTVKTFPTALKAYFLSPDRGVFIYNPFLILMLFGLFLFFRHRGKILPEIRRFIASVLISGLSLNILLLFWRNWYGGFSYGPRIYADALYWFFLAAVIIFGELYINGLIKMKKLTLFFCVLFMSIGLFINLQGIYNSHTMEWNEYPKNLKKHPEIWFDWRYPQFLANKKTLRAKYILQKREFARLKQ